MKVIKLSGSVYENRKLERAGFRNKSNTWR
jgi:hypothetical protein